MGKQNGRDKVLSSEDPADAPIEIKIVDLHKSFGPNKVLRGINLEIRRGEIVAIVGSSGCGKTVLLKHMIGRLRPDQGQVLVADHELADSPLTDLTTLDDNRMDELRRHWAVVFQKNALFTGTVQSNIMLALTAVQGLTPAEAEGRSRDVLERVGLEPNLVMPMARDDLSGGMAKRVAIARALALDPALIFCDEPTSGLDPQLGEQIRGLIREVHLRSPLIGGKRTSVIVTHDAGLLYTLSPRIVMLHEGAVFFDGTSEEFERSDSPIVLPYLDLMPLLHCRVTARPDEAPI